MANRSGLRVSLLERYLLGQIFSRFVAASLIFGVLVAGRLIATLLNKISGHSLPYDVFFELLFYGTLKALPLLLPFCMMAAVFLTFNKLYRDNEAYALYGAGIGYREISSIVARFAAPLCVFLWVFLMHASPQLEERYETLKSEGRQRADTSVVTPGRFVHLRDGLVLFIEHIDDEGLHGIFAAELDQGALNVETARHGVQSSTGDQQQLRLIDGRRYLISAEKQRSRILRYDGHTIPLGRIKPRSVRDHGEEKDLWELARSDAREDRSELQWRASIPIAAFILAMLAFPLSFSDPRENRHTRMVVSVLLYAGYYGALIVITQAMAKGQWPVSLGVWPVHALGVLVIGLLFYSDRIKYFIRGRRP